MIVSDYGNTAAAVRAARENVALVDRSHWGRLKFAGRDRLKLLHNQTTADFNNARAGQIVPAVVLTSIARIVDYVTALITEDAVVTITSPERHEVLKNWFPRFIFFNDEVTVDDVTEETALFGVIGPRSADLLQAVTTGILPEPGRHAVVTVGNTEITVAHGSGLDAPGYTLLVPADAAADVFQTLEAAGKEYDLEPMGQDAWEQLRVAQGRPAADHELTEDHNPLEAGLWHAVSFEKGCYIGQEIVARLDTYGKVKQHLLNVRLDAPAEVGAELYDPDLDRSVGTLTSTTETEDGVVALAYVHRDAATPGRRLVVRTDDGDVDAELVSPRYVRLERPEELPERVG